MNTFDYLDLSKKLTGTPTSTTAPEPLAPADTALEIAKRHAERVKDQKPDVVPSQGAMPIAN
jgi:hypothetical protein